MGEAKFASGLLARGRRINESWVGKSVKDGGESGDGGRGCGGAILDELKGVRNDDEMIWRRLSEWLLLNLKEFGTFQDQEEHEDDIQRKNNILPESSCVASSYLPFSNGSHWRKIILFRSPVGNRRRFCVQHLGSGSQVKRRIPTQCFIGCVDRC